VGVDFLRKTAPSFKKALDRRAIELRTPTLFSHDIPLVARTAAAEICNGSPFTIGETLLLSSPPGLARPAGHESG
jgi:hypothetical protein